jgi:hypothetical protein
VPTVSTSIGGRCLATGRVSRPASSEHFIEATASPRCLQKGPFQGHHNERYSYSCNISLIFSSLIF